MPQDTRSDAPAAASPPPDTGASDGQEPEIIEELLVEEVSIDGMCGVY
jgi:mycofactocin precursor